MKSSKKKIEELRKKFDSLLIEKSESEGLKHDALILMAGYLSEIERIQMQKGIENRNTLAKMIKTSASYLTQVFRGNKPLNFITIAKIQRALDIRFTVHAHYKNELVNAAFNEPASDEVSLALLQHNTMNTKFPFLNLETQIGTAMEVTGIKNEVTLVDNDFADTYPRVISE